MFSNCGFMAWLDLLVMLLALTVAIAAGLVGILSRSKGAAMGLALAALVLSVCVGGVGVLGTMRGRAVTEEAISGESIDPTQKAMIKEEGYKESADCTTIGLGAMVLPLLLSVGALAMAALKKQPAA